MSLAEGSRPSSNVANRAGLARYRNLQEQQLPDSTSSKKSLPNGWFYNESRQEEFWNDLEMKDPNSNYGPSKEDEQARTFSDINTSANRVQSLLQQFDALDQDTLMELMQIIDADDNLGEIDQFAFFGDAKNSVIMNIDELREFAENQSNLMGSIKAWLANAQHYLKVETDNPVTQESLPEVDHVYDYLEGILKTYVERSEKAAFLHNDVNDFWNKQTSQLKRIIYARDEEIRKLQAAVTAAQNARTRKAPKKTKDTKLENELQEKQKQIDSQIRTIQEQKAQIEKLRGSLQNSESERASLQVINRSEPPSPSKLANQHEIAQLNMEAEAKINALNSKIQSLLDELEQIRGKYTEERNKGSSLQKKLTDKEQTIGEMEILLQKYLNQLSLEKAKKPPPKIDTDLMEKEEFYLNELKYNEKLNNLKANHAQELIDQAEALNQKFLIEKNMLLASIDSPDNKSLLQGIVNEYDKRFESQKKEYTETLEMTNKSWAGKVSLLTRQYETRINNMNAAHEIDLINSRDSLKYEVKKTELDIAEKYNKELLEMTGDKQKKINELQEESDKKSDLIFALQKKITLLQQEIEKINPNNPIIKKDNDLNSDDLVNRTNDPTQQQKESFITQRYIQRYNTLKENMDEQHQWDLKMQQHFYDREKIKMIEQHQKDVRRLLLDIQDTVNKVEISDKTEDEKQDTIAQKIATAFVTLNKQLETTQEEGNTNINDDGEKISLDEARKRTQLLTERIVKLTNELEETKKMSQFAVSLSTLEEKIKKLQEKVSFLESIQNDDQKKVYEEMEKMEKDYQDQLKYKDDLVQEMQDLLITYQNRHCQLSEKYIVFDYDSPLVSNRTYNEYDDVDEDEQSTKISIYNPEHISILPQFISESNSLTGVTKNAEEELKRHRRNSEPISSEDPPKETQPLMLPKLNSATPNFQVALTQRPNEPTNNNHNRNRSNPKTQNYRNRKRTLYNMETQISLNEPIVEAALKSILEHLAFKRCDSLTITQGAIEFKDSHSVPKRTQQPSRSTPPKPPNFKAKLFNSPSTAFHRDDNFLYYETIVEEGSTDDESYSEEESEEEIEEKETQQKETQQKETQQKETQQEVQQEHTSLVDENKDENKETNDISEKKQITPMPLPPIPKPKSVKKKKKRMKRVKALICSFKPVPVQPIVIHADEGQMDLIKELQAKLKEQNNDLRSKMLLGIATEASNRFLNTVIKQKFEINELRNISPQVIYQPTIVTIDDNRPDPLGTIILQQQQQQQQLGRIQSSLPSVPSDLSKKKLPRINLHVNDTSSDTPGFITPMISGDLSDLTGYLSNRSHKSTSRVKQRDPIQFIVPPEEDIPDAKLIDDPFTAAVQATISNMRYMAQLKDNEDEILSTLRNDYTAYEAFLRASNIYTDNNASFIENLKDVKESIEKTISSFDVFDRMQRALLNLVRQSKKKAIYLANIYKDLQTKISDEKLEDQTKSLAEVDADEQLFVLFEKVGAALTVVERLGISMTSDETNIFSNLKKEYAKIKPADGKNEKVDKAAAESLLLNTQNFIEGLKKRQSAETEKNHLIEAISQDEIRSTKKKLKHALHQLDRNKREISSSKETISNLQDIIASLKDNLKNEHNINEQALTMYQAQIQTLKDLLKTLDGNDETSSTNSSTPTDLMKQIRREVLSMQTLLDAQTAELRDTRIKFADLQTRCGENEILISRLKQELEESELRAAEFEEKFMKRRDESIFKEADDAAKNAEVGNSSLIEKQQRLQLERAQADQQMILKRNHDLEQKLIKTRKALNEATDEADELRLKFALRQFEETKVDKMTKQTQTTFRIVLRKKQEAPKGEEEEGFIETNRTSPEEEVTPKKNDVQISSTQKEVTVPKNEPVKPVQKVEVQKDQNKEDSLNDQIKINLQEKNNLPPIFKSTNSSAYISLNSSSDAMFGTTDEIGWEETEEEEDHDVYKDNIDEMKSSRVENEFNPEEVYVEVHKPLEPPKPPKSDILKDPKKAKPPKVKPTKPIIVPQPIDNIAIGFGSRPPSRSISSVSNRSRLVTTPVNPANYNTQKPIPDFKDCMVNTSINANFHNNYPSNGRPKTAVSHTKIGNSSRVHNNSAIMTPKSHDPNVTYANMNNEPMETLRITNVQFAHANNSNQNSTRLIIDQSFGPMTGKSNNSAKTFRSRISVDDEEVKSLITRLRNKIKKLTRSNEKKDETISDLNRRISELVHELSRAKIDNIREKDAANKAKIRFENNNQRLSAAMNELVERQEEASALRRQIIRMKHAALPAAPILRRMTRAQREQERLKTQQMQTNSLLEETRSRIGQTQSDNVKNHLNTLIKNSQASLLRMEAKRRYWQDVERKQMMGALGALSLLCETIPDVSNLSLPFTSLFRSMRKTKAPAAKVFPFDENFNIENNIPQNNGLEIISFEKKSAREK
ncbi:hypothetical protein TRFO_34770 [Tritrichomonas foetus]|uniref:Uncharacterized protein n=1 Tax=Tritrichomonas foetus TaxID=1144522 RepID=A0A1J4JID7_9EUKA|nr:hypothetical protein TRFO_34770 [Tritrichomonas foetus]|eukprot:OHS98902.1 hypothetical protein TRFO_34770 [Tritrichomonas foetus]